MFSSSYTRADAIANICVACLSFLGGLGIVVGFILSGQRQLRRQIIVGLGVTDCVIAADVLIGNAYSLSGKEIKGAGCPATSFIYQAATVTSSMWTLCVALVTYVTLCHPRAKPSLLLEKRGAIVFFVAFTLICGLAPAIVGTIVFDQQDIGGICWYPAASLESKLMIFVPRAVTFTLVIAVYARLILFFARRDTSLLGSSIETESGDVSHQVTSTRRRSDFAEQLSFVPGGAAPTPNGSRRPSKVDSALSETVASSPTSAEFPKMVLQAAPTPGTFITPSPATHDLETIRTNGQPSASDSDGVAGPSLAGSEKTGDPTESRRFSEVPERSRRKSRPLSPRAINRRLSLLMALYPLAYLVLFSVSVARLADSLANPDKRQDRRLIFASRLMVYMQGLVDGLIFALIEFLFRRSIRKRS